jgi:hypothetical protein
MKKTKKLRKSSLYKTVLKDYNKKTNSLVDAVVDEKIPTEQHPGARQPSKEPVLNKSSRKMTKNELFDQLSTTITSINEFLFKANL